MDVKAKDVEVATKEKSLQESLDAILLSKKRFGGEGVKSHL